MTAHIHSATSLGYDGKLIEVESDSSNGLPTLIIVGLGNKAVDEAKERVRSAIKNSGLEFPRKRITINLAPADLPKDGSQLDLAIALSILCLSGQINETELTKTLVIGELGLDGTLKPVNGTVGYAEVAKRLGCERIILPVQNSAQASLITGVSVIGAKNLREVFLYITNQLTLETVSFPTLPQPSNISQGPTLDAVYGQAQAKRALVIAAAGAHNVLFAGPPGSGKTMLARTLTSLLPPLSATEMVEVTKLHSLAGEAAERIIVDRPFRAPHHSASTVSLIGGGQRARPGEISLAHRGILFLDELPEFNRAALESLRQPLEDKSVHIARANHRCSYPADFMLVATQNPCPCGFAGDATKQCSCSSVQILNYQRKISGPLLDRIDLFVTVSPVEHDQLLQAHEQSLHDQARMAIKEARLQQQRRFNSSTHTNSLITNVEAKEVVQLQPQAKQLLDKAAKSLNLSARSYFKTIKVGRTIADLEHAPAIEPSHISEALQYRPRPAPC